MSIAIIADVHANIEALGRVFEDMADRGINRIVCLGDVIGYGPNPRECLKMLYSSEVAIMGNHEEAVMFYGEDFNPKARASLEWTKDQLNSNEFDRTENYDLWNFLGTMQQVVEDGDVMYTHGSPRVPTREYVVPADIRNQEKMAGIFDLITKVCFIGHSHIPHIYTSDMKHASPDKLGSGIDIRKLGDRKILINTGSVGQPRDGDPRLSYATFDGNIVRFHRLQYDYQTTVDKIYAEERIPNFLADRLLVGR
ncbi:MAG: metallophosphoesterase family protein [Planctomycetota bacterium]|nr:metallophosphoesterase family protein [Planctomycetota bacterium]